MGSEQCSKIKPDIGKVQGTTSAKRSIDPLSQSLPAHELRKLAKKDDAKCVFDERMFGSGTTHDDDAEKDYFEIMTNMQGKAKVMKTSSLEKYFTIHYNNTFAILRTSSQEQPRWLQIPRKSQRTALKISWTRASSREKV